MRGALAAACAAALLLAAPAAAYAPDDPLAPHQWYLDAIHAFDGWPAPPQLAPVRVAIVDSGVDGKHPELAGRIVLARSFVGGSALTDSIGHGTFVAGQIAALTGNGAGISGIAPNAELVVAKVAEADGGVSAGAEANAIRWAVDHGARVVNLSLGAPRDPRNHARDGFSQAEANAVAYAVRRGAVVVAAVGNGDTLGAGGPYADWPAALPHVLGVAALARGGPVAAFSNRDALYADVAAPGADIFSTLPLDSATDGCADPGYSDCGDPFYLHASGTSFAAPQAAAAAAVLLGLRPELAPEQVVSILERSAADLPSVPRCLRCAAGRDAASGWGRIDLAAAVAALAAPLPPRDGYEPNDDAGGAAHTLRARRVALHATLDSWDDAHDVYRVHLAAGARLRVTARGASVRLALWKPGTLHVNSLEAHLHQLAREGARISYRAPLAGDYFVDAHLTTRTGPIAYTLTLSR
jgi:subtilisin family serine protease